MSTEERLHELADELVEPERDYITEVEAQRFVEQETASHDREFRTWLREQAVHLVNERLTAMVRSKRSSTLQRLGARTFAQHAEALQAGDEEAVGLFSVSFVVDDDRTRRPFGKMERADREYVASAYEGSGNRMLMLAAFIRAVDEQAGEGPTEDAMDEAECERLLRSITGERKEELALAA